MQTTVMVVVLFLEMRPLHPNHVRPHSRSVPENGTRSQAPSQPDTDHETEVVGEKEDHRTAEASPPPWSSSCFSKRGRSVAKSDYLTADEFQRTELGRNLPRNASRHRPRDRSRVQELTPDSGSVEQERRHGRR